MQALIDNIKSIGEMIFKLGELLIQMVKDLAYMVSLLADMLTNIPAYFGWLPSTVVSSVLMLFSFAMLFKILGREG